MTNFNAFFFLKVGYKNSVAVALKFTINAVKRFTVLQRFPHAPSL